MKKTIAIIVLAASLLAALVVSVCYNPATEEVDGKKGYVNPLDKNGDDYLYSNSGGTKDDEDGKLTVGPNGEANLFDTAKYKRCDAVNPTISFAGTKYGESVKINTNEAFEFRRLMNNGQGNTWIDSLITYTSGSGGTEVPSLAQGYPCLSNGPDRDACITVTDWAKTPEPGQYYIRYKVKKNECNGKIPEAVKDRSLTVEQYVAPDTATPVITVTGSVNAEFRPPEPYVDRGAVVTVAGQNSPKLLDSVVVRGPNNYYKKVEKPDGVFTGVVLPDNPPANSTYTITYYASFTGSVSGMEVTKSSTAVRNVTVLTATVKESAVIVLEPYTHKLSTGVSFEYPDTMLYEGSTNANYIEKGVRRVYWKNGAVEVDLPVGDVKRDDLASNFIDGQQVIGGSAGKTVDYRIPAGGNYNTGIATRNVFLVRVCEPGEAKAPPVITPLGKDTIDAGVRWDPSDSWSVKNMDDDRFEGGSGYKYAINFNGLNPNNPVKKDGGYKITYVGLGKCASTAERERTIFVK